MVFSCLSESAIKWVGGIRNNEIRKSRKLDKVSTPQ